MVLAGAWSPAQSSLLFLKLYSTALNILYLLTRSVLILPFGEGSKHSLVLNVQTNIILHTLSKGSFPQNVNRNMFRFESKLPNSRSMLDPFDQNGPRVFCLSSIWTAFGSFLHALGKEKEGSVSPRSFSCKKTKGCFQAELSTLNHGKKTYRHYNRWEHKHLEKVKLQSC